MSDGRASRGGPSVQGHYDLGFLLPSWFLCFVFIGILAFLAFSMVKIKLCAVKKNVVTFAVKGMALEVILFVSTERCVPPGARGCACLCRSGLMSLGPDNVIHHVLPDLETQISCFLSYEESVFI